MNNQQAEALSNEGFNLYQKGKYDEALSKYKKAIDLSKSNYWGLTDIHAGCAMVLRALGEKDKVTEQLELALSAAFKTDSEESITVEIARHALAEHYVGAGEYRRSLDILEPVLKMNTKQSWLLCYVAALAYTKLDNKVKSKEFAEKVIFLAPKGKYSSLKYLLEELKLKKF